MSFEPNYETDRDARMWGMILHLASLANFVLGCGGFLAVLVIWLMKGSDHPFVDNCGREALNLQISAFIGVIVATILIVTAIGAIIGFPLLVAISIYTFVMPIVAGVKANDGVAYRYPFILHLL